MFLFYLSGFYQKGVMVSVEREQQADFEKALQNKGVNFTQLGKTTAHYWHLDGNILEGIKVLKSTTIQR
ncbi:hypothetical protein ACSX1A_00610 [Pontibacter sp. MBLB2868]|uniref:hypothetical protein n=1 Tax=Pontibacter sp. MBLB2868 TaxID=3451555 RepID=UPI003F7526A1